MIIGIGTGMAISYMFKLEELSHVMPPREAAREASRDRPRPISMTTAAAILTVPPLALAIGAGRASSSRSPSRSSPGRCYTIR